MNRVPATARSRAVALHYTGEGAPRVTAQGSDEVAERIVACAREHGIPVREDRDLVQLLATVPLGTEIPPELYVAVAEVLAFAYRIGGREPPGPA